MKDNEQDIQKNKDYIVANTDASKVINVTDLKKDFTVGTQIVSVLKGVTFEINKGEFAVIIGASGSGKSTLLHTLLGLEPPTSGSVKVLDTEIYANTVEDDRSVFRKRHIGMVYQQPNWIRSLSVLENVAFPLILLGIDKTESTKRAWEAIFNVGMREWTNYKPTELSGGQQQKVALARALVINPEIIVADEPTGNLDYESGKNLMEMLVDLNNQGRTIIMVTHDLEYLKYCNTAVRIKDGIVQGVYRGADIENALKDSGLGLKRAEEKDNNQTTNNNKVNITKEDQSPNTIKAQQVIERANKRVEEMKKTDTTPIHELLSIESNEEKESKILNTEVKKDIEPKVTNIQDPTTNLKEEKVEVENKKEVIKKQNNNITNKFMGFFKKENKQNEIEAKVKEVKENVEPITKPTTKVENIETSEIKQPIKPDTKDIDIVNTLAIETIEKVKKPKRRKFKKSKKK